MLKLAIFITLKIIIIRLEKELGKSPVKLEVKRQKKTQISEREKTQQIIGEKERN